MNRSTRLFLFNSIAIVVLLAGCAGGGETGTGGTESNTDIPKLPTPVAVGTITNFGSVFVNGIEFFTNTKSVFTVEGNSSNESELKVGMVVSVRGAVRNDGKAGDATHIEFADDADGVVLSKALTNGVGTLNVMGHTVNVDAATVFESFNKGLYATIDATPVGAVVEVSGFTAPGGNITATRVELKSADFSSGEIETKGVISDINLVAKTFKMGSLTVDFSTAQFKNVTAASLTTSLFVEVKSTQGIVADKLIASAVEAKKDHRRIEGKKGENTKLEGIITNVNSGTNQITVNGQLISVSPSVIGSLRAGQKLEIEGEFDDDGALASKTEIKQRHASSLRIKARIESVQANNKTVTILGQAFHIDALTLFKDDCDSCATRIRQFIVANLSANESVELVAYRVDTKWIIGKLERVTPEMDPATIQGEVTSVNGDVISIGGIQVKIANGSPPRAGTHVELAVANVNGILTTIED